MDVDRSVVTEEDVVEDVEEDEVEEILDGRLEVEREPVERKLSRERRPLSKVRRIFRSIPPLSLTIIPTCRNSFLLRFRFLLLRYDSFRIPSPSSLLSRSSPPSLSNTHQKCDDIFPVSSRLFSFFFNYD